MNEPLGASAETPPVSVTFAKGGLSWSRSGAPRVLSHVAKALYVLTGLGVVTTAFEAFVYGALFSLMGTLAWPLFIVSYALTLTQTSFHGTIEASRDRLVVVAGTRRRVFPRAKVKSAYVVEREVSGGVVPTVEIELTNGDILSARSPDRGAARAVVAALGFGPGGKRVHVALAKPTRRLLHPLLAFATWALAAVLAWAPSFAVVDDVSSSFGLIVVRALAATYPVIALGLYAAMKRTLRAPEVTVGSDGMLVVSGRRQRFIPRRDLSSVAHTPDGALAVELRTGERIFLRGLLVDDARRATVARLFEERSDAAAVARVARDRFAHYERGGRQVSEWRAHLARTMSEAGYRETAATADEAAAILRSADATGEQRIGAALALRVANLPKEHIRVAAEAAVDDHVREALEAVAASDDDAPVDRALRKLG